MSQASVLDNLLVSQAELRRLGARPSAAREIVRNREYRSLVTSALALAGENPDNRELAEFVEAVLAASARARTEILAHVLRAVEAELDAGGAL